jgi:uncharacterized protein (TIGR00369 family)
MAVDRERTLATRLENHFTRSLGFRQEVEEGFARGRGWSVPELCVPGTEYPHISVLLTLSDMVTGMQANVSTAPRVAVTVDLRTRLLHAPPMGAYTVEGRVLRTGATLTVADATLTATGDDAPFAKTLGSFIASPRPDDVVPGMVDPSRHQQSPWPERPTLTVPFTELVGLRVLEPGVTEVALRPDLSNATDTFQGGIVSFLGETAAQTLASDAAGATFVVDDIDVRYLRAARVGPARATATLYELDDEIAAATVEIRDTGMDNRLTAYVTAECRRL